MERERVSFEQTETRNERWADQERGREMSEIRQRGRWEDQDRERNRNEY